MRANWVSGGVILLAAVAILATLFAGVVVMGCVPVRPRDAESPPPALEDASNVRKAEVARSRP